MSSDNVLKKLPLEGIRVLDFTWILAGPFATAMMADFGAEVIKVQSHKIANGTEQNDSYYFAALNRNKRSITLDMSRPEAREIVLKLASKCDMVIQNFTPRVMENWGLGTEAFNKANPGIIVINLSAMGNTGPWRDFAALSDTMDALAGMDAGDNPLLTGYPYSDIVSGLLAFNTALAALEKRTVTDQGCNIEISELEALSATLGFRALFSSLTKTSKRELDIPQAPRCCRCKGKDAWCIISVQTEEQWQDLCKLMGSPGWISLPQFASAFKRDCNRTELDGNIEKWTSGITPKTVMRLLQSKGIPCSTVKDVQDLANDPQLRYSNFFSSYIHPSLGKITYPGNPFKMSAISSQFQKAAPLLGEDNEYVFEGLLGMSRDKFVKFTEEKIIY